MIQRDAIRIELHALPDKGEWILSAAFSIERSAKVVREPERTLEEEIATASAALREMIFAQLYAGLKDDIWFILSEVLALEERDIVIAGGRLDRIERALEALYEKLK